MQNIDYIKASVKACYQKVFWGLTPLVTFYAVFEGMLSGELIITITNAIMPILLIMALLPPAFHLLKEVPESMWSPAVWLLISFSVFFGFGPLVTVFGSEQAKLYMDYSHAAATGEDVLAANKLSAVGIYFTVIGWLASCKFKLKSRRDPPPGPKYPSLNPVKISIWFVVGGFVFQHFLIYQSDWKVIDIVIPGSLKVLGSLVNVGYALLIFCALRSRQKILIYLFFITWPVHFSICFLALDKSDLVLAMVFPAIGAFLAHGSRNKLFLSVFIAGLVFMLSQPWVAYGRYEIKSEAGNIHEANLAERAGLFVDYLSGSRNVKESQDGTQAWWRRLNYTGVQAYAIRAYDAGLSGDTISQLWMYLIPRAIWPGKPIVEGPGKEFYYLVTGNDLNTFMGLSVFGDIYWQWGWWGIVSVCPFIGALFSSISWRSINIINGRYFLMIPLVLIGLDMAMLGMTRFLTNGIVSSLPIYYGYLFLATLVPFLLKRKRSSLNEVSQ